MLTYLNAKSLTCFFSMFNVALPLHAYHSLHAKLVNSTMRFVVVYYGFILRIFY